MRQAHLLQILEALYAAFPHLQPGDGLRRHPQHHDQDARNSSLSCARPASPGPIWGWRAAGMQLLKKVNKGVTSEQMLQAGCPAGKRRH